MFNKRGYSHMSVNESCGFPARILLVGGKRINKRKPQEDRSDQLGKWSPILNNLIVYEGMCSTTTNLEST